MITATIRSELPRMSGSLRKVAEGVLADPAAATHGSAAELGRRTGTSQATVTRFCRALGLDSYQQLLIELAQEQGAQGAQAGPDAQAALGPRIGPDDDLEKVIAVVAEADLRALRHTAEHVDREALERAAQALAKARRIDVYGVGGSGIVAHETQARLFGIGCAAHAWTEVHAAETSAALLTPSDAVVAVSHSGTTREVLEPLRLAADRGATTIAVTGDPRSPIARAADITLTFFSGETSFRRGNFGTRHSVLLLVDCLYARVAQLTYERATASIALTAHIADGHSTRKAPGRRGDPPRSPR
ncbi:MurR/RpiR family transcriptional regulator [Actinacidiphila guanduensis]|uniref:Transcriptional regulator, RpiR family n=1 Tax=Actinacidiphila guanduensis TaxID=310781 RepID=A0A1H0DY93_9ACTN|nr:MurR/RpiR family transcriptional regulator [Actinacidiphila guanduensis]SDN75079.1 transcriptional regulator, RpiR family [Actinacidiphila guanduensis]